MAQKTTVAVAVVVLAGWTVYPTLGHPSSSPISPPPSPPGGGNFGMWFTDSFGLPAYRYSGHPNASSLPKLTAPLEPVIAHQVGNDRVVGVAYTDGSVSVRQDEGGPKLLHFHSPTDSQYRGGFGYLTELGSHGMVASTMANGTVSPEGTPGFGLEFGVGYVRKIVENVTIGVSVSHVVAAVFGDDAVLLSEITFTDTRDLERVSSRGDGAAGATAAPHAFEWTEVWGQMRSDWLLHERDGYFSHHITSSFVKGVGTVLVDRPTNEATVCVSHGPPPGPGSPPQASFEDCHPAQAFMASIGDDGADVEFTTSGHGFFGAGGALYPQGLDTPLDNSPSTTGNDTVMVMRRTVIVPQGGSIKLRFLVGYARPDVQESVQDIIARYSSVVPSLLTNSSAAWRDFCSQFSTTGPSLDADVVNREVQWHAYNLRAGLTYDSFRGEHILNQGGLYIYYAGMQGAARDPLSHVMPFIMASPDVAKYVKEVVRYTLKEVQNDPRTGIPGWIPYGQQAFGLEGSHLFWPSDLENYLLVTAAQYVLATRDSAFLDEPLVPTNQTCCHDDKTVGDMLWTCWTHLRDSTGVSETTGLITLLNVDHNDGLLFHINSSRKIDFLAAQMNGSSVMNTALAVYAFAQYADVLRLTGQADRATEVDALGRRLRTAVESAWATPKNGSGFYKRVDLSATNGGWLGDERDGVMWTETQAWALLADAAPSRVPALVAKLDSTVRQPSPVGALNTGRYEGAGDYAGVWWCGNMALICGLARYGYVDMALDEFRKNLLATHATVYPDIWFGVWSGPDTFNSVLMEKDPQFKGMAESIPGATRTMTIGLPVLNMWTHSSPLYSALSWVGTTFTAEGVWFSPTFSDTSASFSISSPLVGLAGDGATFCCNFSGWYRPVVVGTYKVTLSLPPAIATCCHSVRFMLQSGEVVSTELDKTNVSFTATSHPDAGIVWHTEKQT